jgi:hypothetical protein
VLSAWFVPRRMVAPFVVLLAGIGTFVVIAGAGLSVIDRYLLMPAVMILVFCAFALTGWTMLEHGLLRKLWASGAVVLMGIGVYLAASTLSLNKIETELGFRDSGQTSLVAILDKPQVRRDLACGPVSVPDHKLVPDIRLILNLGRAGVIDRGDARYLLDKGQPALFDAEQHGVALYPLGLAVIRYALTSPNDSPLDQVPLAGFKLIAHTGYYAAYARC